MTAGLEQTKIQTERTKSSMAANLKSPPKKVTAPKTATPRKQAGIDVPHVVRVTVLGLDGVAFNSDSQSSQTKVPTPDQLRAFISLSRTSSSTAVRTSTLSQPLCRSQKHNVLIKSGNSENFEEFEIANAEVEEDDVDRYVAIWSSQEDGQPEDGVNPPLDSKVGASNANPNTTAYESSISSINAITFETNLRRRNHVDNPSSSPKSSDENNAQYAPKSFEVTIGLAANSTQDRETVSALKPSKSQENAPAFGLPLGVATLAISGNECNAKVLRRELDLPVLSLAQTRPMFGAGSKNEVDAESELILLSKPKKAPSTQSPSPTAEENVTVPQSPRDTKKKSRGLRFFRSSKKKDTPNHVSPTGPKMTTTNDYDDTFRNPNSAQVSAFKSTYSIVSSGDGGVLRLLVEVYEKGSELEKSAKAYRQQQRQRARNIHMETLAAAAEARKERDKENKLHSVSPTHNSDHHTDEGSLSDLDNSSHDEDETNCSHSTMDDDDESNWDEITASTLSTQSTGKTGFTSGTEDDTSTLDQSLDSTIHTDGESCIAGNNESDNNVVQLVTEDEDSDVDDDEDDDATHVTINFHGRKVKVFTPNPLHLACRGGADDDIDDTTYTKPRQSMYHHLIGSCQNPKVSETTEILNNEAKDKNGLTFVSHTEDGRGDRTSLIMDDKGNTISPRGVADMNTTPANPISKSSGEVSNNVNRRLSFGDKRIASSNSRAKSIISNPPPRQIVGVESRDSCDTHLTEGTYHKKKQWEEDYQKLEGVFSEDTFDSGGSYYEPPTPKNNNEKGSLLPVAFGGSGRMLRMDRAIKTGPTNEQDVNVSLAEEFVFGNPENRDRDFFFGNGPSFSWTASYTEGDSDTSTLMSGNTFMSGNTAMQTLQAGNVTGKSSSQVIKDD